MPEETGSEISKLTLSVRSLMGMPVEEAHRELTDAGVPYLDPEDTTVQIDELTSSSLNDMGGATDPDDLPLNKFEAPPAVSTNGRDHPTSNQFGAGNLTYESKTTVNDISPPGQRPYEKGVLSATELEMPGDKQSMHLGHFKNSPTIDKREKNQRSKHKEQWDRRLLSYVRNKQEEENNSDEQKSSFEHNLAVEVVARAAVCAYEKTRGRDPEPMAQSNPGYDIISRDSLTGEDRFIEVKGVNGEWNQTGVGLSRLQFSNAQDYGDRYWLYVVEFISDPDHLRVHPIRSPASQVTSFMFDGNWRDAVVDERADPALAFIAGARVRHKSFGLGLIESMERRGSTRVMSIEFENSGRRTVTLNLQTMTVVREDDDNDHS